MRKYALILLMSSTLFFVRCKKDSQVQTPATPSAPTTEQVVSIHVSPSYQTQNLLKNKFIYRNAANDSFSVSKWQFYLSNFKFIDQTGGEYNIDESYYLIDAFDEARHTIRIKNVKPGTYVGLKFLVGVDSTRNVSGAQTGDLQQVYGMFWSWSQGYIFSKLEGDYITSNATPLQNFSHHVGGFLAPYNCIEQVSLSFLNTPLQISSNSKNEMTINANLETYFNGATTIDLLSYQAVTGGRNGKTISTNYKNMFSATLVKN